MRVIHYIASLDKTGGGVSTYIQQLSSRLGKYVELSIITHSSPNPLALENCNIYYIERKYSKIIKIKKEIECLLDKIQPDVVHANGCWQPICSLFIKLAKRKNIPVVLSPHGMLDPWILQKNRWTKKIPAMLLFQRKSIKLADVIVCTSYNEENSLKRLGVSDKVTIIPNGVETKGVEIKKTWRRNKLIFFLALMRPNKGAHLLIEAVANLKEKLNGWSVVIAGKDNEDYLAYLKSLVVKKGLQNIVTFPGALFGEDKWDMYRKADVFVLPTLNENFGIVIAEAYLCGTPVITCKGAPWPIIEDEKIGWWCNRSVESLTDCLKDFLIRSESELKYMGRRGREIVEQKYSAEAIALRFVEMYNSILN